MASAKRCLRYTGPSPHAEPESAGSTEPRGGTTLITSPEPHWEAFFDQLAPRYLENPYTAATVAEVDFLLDVLALPAGARVLDIGCGPGRHCVEFARRGHRPTGLDLSAGMLQQAAEAARRAEVHVDWVHVDATRFRSAPVFDAAICLMQGAFGLLNIDDDPVEHDLAILRAVFGALRPGARLLMTTLNGYVRIRQLTQADVLAGRFDPAAMLETSTAEWELAGGRHTVHLKERRYLPPELAGLCRAAGFAVEHLWGAGFGRWSRRVIDLDDPEVMVVARKPGSVAEGVDATG